MRLKIWHKMIIGISIPSLITLLGGVLTYEYINNTDTRQGYVQIADDLKEQVLEVRRNEKNFLHYRNEEALHNLTNAISVLNASIKDISPRTINEIGPGDFLLLSSYIKKYPEDIQELYNTYHNETAVVEDVRTEGRRLESMMKGRQGDELSISFILHLRLLEKNYMLFRDKESYRKLNEGLAKLNNIIPICVDCGPYIKSMHNLFKTYEKGDSLINELQSAGNKLEGVTKRIAVRERQKIGLFLTKTKRVLFIALLLLSILGPMFVYKTATYIVAPINRLSEITNRISKGNINLRAPIREHDETYSLALSFNSMLDKLQLTHESLEKSMELLSEKQAQLVDSEKRASLGLLVSGVAHELNNPLNNISLIAERLTEEREDISKEELKGLQNILMQCDRAKHIVDDLLDFARARKSTVMDKQDLVKIINGSFNLVANQLRINDIDLKKEVPETPLFIKGNHSKLEQILVSIYTNAMQAMGNKGMLTVSLEKENEDGGIVLKISDTGPGIPEENIRNIFEPFFTTKPVGEGTGLGLSVCRSLVQEHNGVIEVESRLGEGTTFIIKFPPYHEAV